ncbi:MAG: 23S rRNA (guanosine(2251)-2'-O)-methyltransferase RlmB [Ruminococcaceae bacterium]|nr:23S rRNA (guanosine(2251)-2'-O)-methyltransferase RlmB [Oscillospiraceae bacterium]
MKDHFDRRNDGRNKKDGKYERSERRENGHDFRSNDREDRPERRDDRRDDLIIGRNAASEALKAGREIDCVYIAKGERNGAVVPILAKCKDRNIPIKEVDSRKLDFMCGHANHQGILLSAAAHAYATVEDILAKAEEKGEPPFIILCDGLEDPHNLGAIIRTAECCGAHGVIVPQRRSVGLTGAVGKASAGALEYVPVARVTNLVATIEMLKEKNIWVYAADADGTAWNKADLTGAVALVIGSEGNGVGRLVKEKCDGVLSIPMKGQINSLNASVAAAILMAAVTVAREG